MYSSESTSIHIKETHDDRSNNRIENKNDSMKTAGHIKSKIDFLFCLTKFPPFIIETRWK